MNPSMLRGILAFVALFLVVSCESSSSRSTTNNQEPQTAMSQQKVATSPEGTLTDEALLALVKKFAAGIENEPAVLQDLARSAQTDVTGRLRRLQDAPAVDNRDKIAIAFLLCNLNYEVGANEAVIVRALTEEPHSRNFDADSEAELVGRLIRKGHTDLLPALFSSAQWSDGAMSEFLSDFFADQVRTAPQEFVRQLSRQPDSVRKSVYARLQLGGLTNTDVDQFRKYSNSLTDPAMKSVAREILTTIRNGDSG